MAPDGVRIAHVDDIEGVPGQHYVEGEWKPVRAELGIDAFGANAYVADAGQLIVVEHDELDADDPGASHRELYVVLRGRAEFTLAGETVDAPAGTLVYLHDPAVVRALTTAPEQYYRQGGRTYSVAAAVPLPGDWCGG